MMKNEESIRQIIDQLLENALQEYYATEEYRLLREKREKMQADCALMFTGVEGQFAQECFSLLSDIAVRERKYAYRRGLLDCAAFLKILGAQN